LFLSILVVRFGGNLIAPARLSPLSLPDSAPQQTMREYSKNNDELTFAMAARESYSAAAVGFSERRIDGS
jgi:hypothetical protein